MMHTPKRKLFGIGSLVMLFAALAFTIAALVPAGATLPGPAKMWGCVSSTGMLRTTSPHPHLNTPPHCPYTSDVLVSWDVNVGAPTTTTSTTTTTVPDTTTTVPDTTPPSTDSTTITVPDTTPPSTDTTTTVPVSTVGCTNPVSTMHDPPQDTNYIFGTGYPTSIRINTNVWGGYDPYSESMSYCADGSWNLSASISDTHGGAIQAYPDTEYVLGDVPGVGKTVAQLNGISTCYGEQSPPISQWNGDWGYDVWINYYGVELMVWNRWTQSAYPPSNANHTVINGLGYSTWDNSNEHIYAADVQNDSGCIDLLPFLNDLVARGILTSSAIPNSLQYGVELAGATPDQTFAVTGISFNPS